MKKLIIVKACDRKKMKQICTAQMEVDFLLTQTDFSKTQGQVVSIFFKLFEELSKNFKSQFFQKFWGSLGFPKVGLFHQGHKLKQICTA